MKVSSTADTHLSRVTQTNTSVKIHSLPMQSMRPSLLHGYLACTILRISIILSISNIWTTTSIRDEIQGALVFSHKLCSLGLNDDVWEYWAIDWSSTHLVMSVFREILRLCCVRNVYSAYASSYTGYLFILTICQKSLFHILKHIKNMTFTAIELCLEVGIPQIL